MLLVLPWTVRAGEASSSTSEQQSTHDPRVPEIVRVENVRGKDDMKILTVGNTNGHYRLVCNIKAAGCINPVPARDYLLFNKDTSWKMPGATSLIDLKFVQDWTVNYRDVENIGLVPKDSGGPGELGMYIFESWSAKQR